ncbi:MAG: type I-E CRISPR-associated endonuclease Cas1 [Armatimonadetes bacterium]|nr:type I-E CRISPR-associated endonuclease Cas1 [Armatimonadota bacterium]
MEDLHQLPKFRDCLSYLYLEHCRVDQHEKSIAAHDVNGMTPVPAASLSVLLLGPGVSVTHAAVLALADNNCLVVWCGEQGVRFYAHGMGGTRSARALLHQAGLVSDAARRMDVVRRMYEVRFSEPLPDRDMSIEQLRGLEGARVRNAYAAASREHGVPWTGRNYNRSQWDAADPVNRALSAANAALYGICHAAILSLGYSPALGFIHTGKQLSFVYDVADLYKTEISIPVAFEAAKEGLKDVERRVRLRCRDRFREARLLPRIVYDLQKLLGQPPDEEFAPDSDPALPTPLWSPGDTPGAKEG